MFCKCIALTVAMLAAFVRIAGASTLSDVSVAVHSASLLPPSLLPTTRPQSSTFAPRVWIPSGYHLVRDIPYVPHARLSQCLDVYVPNVPTAPRPLMIWIHGGGWYSGDKSAPPGMGLLLRGFIVASINYRLSGEAVFPAQVYDCKAAVRFLRAHCREFGVDPTRIGVWGDSAGGHLASLLGVTNGRLGYEGNEGTPGVSSNVQAVCDWFGPSDFLQASEFRGLSATATRQLFGGMVSTRLNAAAFASPAEQVGRGPIPPFLIMHGDEDTLVPVHQSEILFDRLQMAGATVRLIVISHGGHGNGWFRNSRDLGLVYDFFERSLGTPLLRPMVRANTSSTRPSM